jgi:hypothetical protein
MTRIVPGLLLVCCLMLCPASVFATPVHLTNSYLGISERNVFRLVPRPVQHLEPPPPPIATITLRGVTSILGKRQAILDIQFPAKAAQPAKKESCVLGEQEHDGQVEVLEVNPSADSVKVNNFGTVMVLTFDKNGPKTPNKTPPPASLVQARFPLRNRASLVAR